VRLRLPSSTSSPSPSNAGSGSPSFVPDTHGAGRPPARAHRDALDLPNAIRELGAHPPAGPIAARRRQPASRGTPGRESPPRSFPSIPGSNLGPTVYVTPHRTARTHPRGAATACPRAVRRPWSTPWRPRTRLPPRLIQSRAPSGLQRRHRRLERWPARAHVRAMPRMSSRRSTTDS
jgi:hypothetical protein